MPSQRLCERLRNRRFDRTLDAAAAELGVHKSTYQQWETGKNLPSRQYYRRLCAWLGEEYDDFVIGLADEQSARRELRFADERETLASKVEALTAEVEALAKLVVRLEKDRGEGRNGRP